MAEMTGRRAIFLDRDGVINANRPDHVKSWDEFVFLPRTLQALRALAASDFVLVVTTNQAAINRGLVREQVVRDIHSRMCSAIEDAGGRIDAVYYCPHTPAEHCDCRKPLPGLYLRAAREMGIDLEHSYVVGDALADLDAALAIGARPVLVESGRGCDRRNGQGCLECGRGCAVCADLMDAVEWIRGEEKERA